MDLTSVPLMCLISSMHHWERDNVNALYSSDANVDGEACRLCHQYASWDNNCAGCPVAAYSGQNGCKGTPWKAAADALDDWQWSTCDAEFDHPWFTEWRNREAFKNASRDMLQYLKDAMQNWREVTRPLRRDYLAERDAKRLAELVNDEAADHSGHA